MSIKQEIISWDGKSSRDITAIYNRHSNENSFSSKLIEFSQQAELQKGATWLIKHHLECGWKIQSKEIATIYKHLPKLEHWETKLHILQCIPYMPINKTAKKYVEFFLRKCLSDNNKFVRAWTYNGFYLLSLQHSEYQQETQQLFELAMTDEAASVKARIRNIMKKGF